MDQVTGRKAYSLMEVIIALFLLAVASLLVINLFHVALQRTRGTDNTNTARLLTAQRLAEVRAWAVSGGYKEPDSLDTIDGSVTNPPGWPEFKVTVRARPFELYSPSKELEWGLPPAERKTIQEAVALVEVTTEWETPGGNGTFSLTGLLPRAPQSIEKIEVDVLGPNTLSRNGTVQLSAMAIDSSGNPIQGLTYGWWVEPMSGDATIKTRSNSSQADLIHRIDLLDGSSKFFDGSVRIGVATRFGGILTTDDSTEVLLVP